jgi:hypothetical protein
MGCGGSKGSRPKSDVVDPSSPGRGGGGGGHYDSDDVEIAYKGGSEVKKRVHTIMALKARLAKSTHERCGLEYHLEQMRGQLSRSSETVQRAKDEYLSLLNDAMERDADELFRALTTSSRADKMIMIDVLTARTRWQLNLITEAYEKKHHVPLLKIIKENLRTSMGLLTGSNSDLGRLLLLIAMDQPERDAQLLTQHLGNFDIITEVCWGRATRMFPLAIYLLLFVSFCLDRNDAQQPRAPRCTRVLSPHDGEELPRSDRREVVHQLREADESYSGMQAQRRPRGL